MGQRRAGDGDSPLESDIQGSLKEFLAEIIKEQKRVKMDREEENSVKLPSQSKSILGT